MIEKSIPPPNFFRDKSSSSINPTLVSNYFRDKNPILPNSPHISRDYLSEKKQPGKISAFLTSPRGYSVTTLDPSSKISRSRVVLPELDASKKSVEPSVAIKAAILPLSVKARD